MRLLDLFSGRWGWSMAFAARGWECVGVDLVEPPEIPKRCEFWKVNVLDLDASLEFGRFPFSEGFRYDVSNFDFIVASPPCEEFSVWGMKMFHPNPKYPEMGIKLFNHTRSLCEASGVPYVMENVRTAQVFVGTAVNRCGPFYLWGNAVPPLLPQGISKGTYFKKGSERKLRDKTWNGSKSKSRQEATAGMAAIPVELANCVCDYAERILERVA